MTTLRSHTKKVKISGIRRNGLFVIIPLFLLLSGSFLICYAGWNLFSQTYLISKVMFIKPHVSIPEKKYTINNTPMERPKLGSYMGKIKIPSISLEYPLIHGDDSEDLRKGAGHYAGSTLPGEGGNCIISGHNTTVFKDLGKVKIGDTITLETFYGTFNYKASEIKIVQQDDRNVIVDSDREMLTLYTCYPFRYIGSTPKRYVLLAEFVNSTGTKELDKGSGK